MRVTISNDQDTLHAGSANQRLAWEAPDPLLWSEPTKCERDADTWAEVCPTTDFETGQLVGKVGTPEDPLFTYEQAVHHRRGRKDFMLCVGAAIPTEEKDRLSEATIKILQNSQAEVEANQLSKLTGGVVPRGWDAWGRPWAFMNCPAEKVPQVTSNQGCDQVTVAVLMDFPPEPFYFPSVALIDYALRYKSKAGRKGKLASGLELDEDSQWREVRQQRPSTELLREHCWEAFQNGTWGNRPNPDVPEGDVRPPGRAIAVPSGSSAGIELPPISAPDSPTSRESTPSSASHSLRQAVPSSDQEEAAEEEMELTIPASPPKTTAPHHAPSNNKLAQAVTDMVFQVRQTMATTSTVTSSQCDSQASRYTTRDPLSMRIARVRTTESSQP